MEQPLANNHYDKIPTWELGTDGDSERRLVLRVGPCTPAQLVRLLGALLEVEQALKINPDTKDIPESLKHDLARNLLKNSKSKDDG